MRNQHNMKNLTKNQWIAVGVAVVVVAYFAYGSTFLNLFRTQDVVGQSANQQIPMTDVQITDETVGSGDVAATGDTVSALYTGMLENGTVFDASNLHGNQPISFVLGSGQVIKGWDQGIVGMKVGGKRKLVIPAELAYGNQSVGSIPANSTLVFEVELVGVKKASN